MPIRAAALGYYRKSFDAIERWLRERPSADARASHGDSAVRFGKAYHERGDCVSAVAVLKRGQADLESLTREFPDNQRYSRLLYVIYDRLGSYTGNPDFFNLGDRKTAAAYYLKVQAINDKALSDSRNNRAKLDRALNLVKLLDVEYGPPEDRVRRARESIEILNGLLATAPGQFTFIRAIFNSYRRLARALAATGDWRASLAASEQSKVSAEEAVGKNPDDLGALESLGLSLTEIGVTSTVLGRYREAAAALGEAGTLFSKLRAKYPKDLYFLRDMADVYAAQGALARREGRLSDARELYSRCLATWDEWPKVGVSTVFNQTRRAQIARLLAEVVR